jgi:hypothetical protein
MPFDNTGLVSLLSNSGFNLWLYRTSDTRATALGAGYFAPAASQLLVGDVMLLQASDALTLTTIRAGNVVAAGLVVDSAATPFRVNRNAAQRFSVRQVASAVAMTVLLAPLLGGIVAGSTVQAQAAIAGPVEQVLFSIRDANGATVRGPQAAPVSGGAASASLPAPEVGSGYRLRVEALGFPQVADTSPAFAVTPAYALLRDGATGTLLLEDGGRLLN